MAVSGAKAEKTQGAMNQYNDACALASWAACVYTVAKAEDLVDEKVEQMAPLSLEDIYGSKPGLTLYVEESLKYSVCGAKYVHVAHTLINEFVHLAEN